MVSEPQDILVPEPPPRDGESVGLAFMGFDREGDRHNRYNVLPRKTPSLGLCGTESCARTELVQA